MMPPWLVQEGDREQKRNEDTILVTCLSIGGLLVYDSACRQINRELRTLRAAVDCLP